MHYVEDAVGRDRCKRRVPARGSVGNQKTAVKVSIGTYMQMGSTGFSESYNPLALTTVSATWTDLNKDGIPQGERGCTYLAPGCEINIAQLPAGFGTANIATFDPNIKRRRYSSAACSSWVRW